MAEIEASLYNWSSPTDNDQTGPDLSVVVPMYNEAENAPILVREIADALQGYSFEIVVVDDRSSDKTRQILGHLRADIPQLRVICHSANAGQSRSVRTGIIAAKAPIISTLDGDGQNNPADIPALFGQLTRKGAPDNLVMVAGERQKRQDSKAKLYASSFANKVRQRLLDDGAKDSGCGLKVFYREAFLRLPYFDHVHRYLPALIRRDGLKVEFCPISHRPRLHGVSKYNNLQRGFVAIRDLMGVLWLKARSRHPGKISEL